MGNTTTHTQYTTSNTSSSTTPLNTTRPEPYRTLQQLTHAELITPARKTIAQLARTQRPYPNHIPNRYYRHFQRYFDPDAALEHLLRHTLPHCPPHQSYCIAVDGTTVPRTGKYPPGVHWIPNPADAPFARGRRWAQRFVCSAGWTTTPTLAVCPFTACPPSPPRRAMPTLLRVARRETAGEQASAKCALGWMQQGVRSSCCCVWATGAAAPRRWGSGTCRVWCAVCARAKTRAGATCRRKPPQGGGVRACIARRSGRPSSSGSSARGGDGCL
jgi:hypothetical protein